MRCLAYTDWMIDLLVNWTVDLLVGRRTHRTRTNQKSQLLKHQKKNKERHVSKRNIHTNTEMISLYRLDDGLVGGLDCGLVGALDDAQVVLAVDWTIE